MNQYRGTAAAVICLCSIILFCLHLWLFKTNVLKITLSFTFYDDCVGYDWLDIGNAKRPNAIMGRQATTCHPLLTCKMNKLDC